MANIFVFIRSNYADSPKTFVRDEKSSQLIWCRYEENKICVGRLFSSESNRLFYIVDNNRETDFHLVNQMTKELGFDINETYKISRWDFERRGQIVEDVIVEVLSKGMYKQHLLANDPDLARLYYLPKGTENQLMFKVTRVSNEPIPVYYRHLVDEFLREKDFERGVTTSLLKLADGRIVVSCKVRPLIWDYQPSRWLCEYVMLLNDNNIKLVHETRETTDDSNRINDGVTGLYLSRSKKSLVIQASEGRFELNCPPRIVTTIIKL